nr:leucine--tRNA ligase [Actinomycetota bacterium]
MRPHPRAFLWEEQVVDRGIKRSYEPREIEPKWQAVWEREGLYLASDEDDGRPRFYALDMFPYPSGDLHMGHAEAFAIGDVIARYQWMRGRNVLHPIGWDGFGLPAENAAIKRGVHPKQWTYANIEQQRSTFRRYGVSFDWTRQFNTCDPDFYRWTQWLFLQLFNRGLAYRKKAPANWCPKDQTVLANEQVIAGRCERCDTPVVRKDLTQWFFKMTEYADRLLDDMDGLEWSDRVLTLQRNWIGRSTGAEVVFEIAETGDRVPVFTTRPDTLWGVTFFVLSPEHPLVGSLAEAGGSGAAVRELQDRVQAMAAADRDRFGSREGVPLGVSAVNPVNGEKVPCYVAPYVLMEYGTGAVMGVPAHDQRDLEFAREHQLDVHVVIRPEDGHELPDAEGMTEALASEGVMVDSGPFDGVRSPDGIGAVIEWLQDQGKGKAARSYRLRDWLISRQRYWGAPIPIIHCPTCGEVPVPEEDLPVVLPEDVDFSPQGESPLAKHAAFVEVQCPRCGKGARRETDTMDTFVDSSWYYLRYPAVVPDKAFSPEAVERWMPVHQYIGGIEHATGHLLYSRFIAKVLFDLGMIPFNEPFRRVLNQGMVINEGAALSKSRGNVVEPLPLIENWGADTIRTTMLFAGPPEDDVDWATVSPAGVHKWLGRAWRAVIDAAASADQGSASGAAAPEPALRRLTHRTIKSVSGDYERFAFNVAVSKLMTLTTAIQRAVESGSGGPPVREAAESLVLMLAPFAPHVAEELWRGPLGHDRSVHVGTWPAYDAKLTLDEKALLV